MTAANCLILSVKTYGIIQVVEAGFTLLLLSLIGIIVIDENLKSAVLNTKFAASV